MTIPHNWLHDWLVQAGTSPTKVRACNEPDSEAYLRCALVLLEYFEESAVARSVHYLRDLASGKRGVSTTFPALHFMNECTGDHDLAMALQCPSRVPEVLVPGLQTNVYMRAR